MTGLKVSPDLELPLEFATEAWAILARRGAGKSNAGVVVAEELYRNDLPFVVIDPKGDWWGIRSSADGNSDGLAVPVFGGRHGDLPLPSNSGAVLADLVLADQSKYLSCVLDVSEFTKGEARRFLHEFADRLFRRKDESGVLTLIFEEAHEYLPQKVGRDEGQLVNVFQRIVKQGRQRGLGCGMLSQRSASLNKDVLTQVGCLIPMWIMSPQDRAAIKEWVQVGGEAKELIDSLHTLRPGEAWVWWPEHFEGQQRMMFHRRWTFDSGATPKPGEPRPVPRVLADVDLAAIKEEMADAVEAAQNEDIGYLRAQIHALEVQLEDEREKRIPLRPPLPEPIEVPVLTDAQLATLEGALVGFEQATDELHKRFERALAVPLAALNRMAVQRDLPDEMPAAPPETPVPSQPLARGGEEVARGRARGAGESVKLPPPLPAAGGGPSLDKAARAVLSVLAQFPQGRTRNQLALLTGYRAASSTLDVALSKLRRAGLVTPSGLPTITDEGLANVTVVPLPQGEDLFAYWLRHDALDRSARLVLQEMRNVYPSPLTRGELAERTGYRPDASTLDVALSKLRKLELVDGWRLADDFAAMIGRSR